MNTLTTSILKKGHTPRLPHVHGYDVTMPSPVISWLQLLSLRNLYLHQILLCIALAMIGHLNNPHSPAKLIPLLHLPRS